MTLRIFQALAKEEFSGAVHCFPNGKHQDSPHGEQNTATNRISSDVLLVQHWEPLLREIKTDSESDLFRTEYTSMEYQKPYVVFVRQVLGPAPQYYIYKASISYH